jgi:hypothetical protein
LTSTATMRPSSRSASHATKCHSSTLRPAVPKDYRTAARGRGPAASASLRPVWSPLRREGGFRTARSAQIPTGPSDNSRSGSSR